jgi:arylsulfatase A-like enzyme
MNSYARRILAVLGFVSCICVSAADRPNIIFLLADDLGRMDVGFTGGTEIRTPNLDKLAKKGAVLDAFYVQPVCSPTRAALMTGRYPMRHGLQVGVVRPWANYGLPLEERTLAQALKEGGYRTALVGKWHLGHFEPEYLPTRRGFDHQYGHFNGALDYFTHIRDGGFDWHRDDKVCRDAGYTTVLLGTEAVGLIEKHNEKVPLFLYVPFNAPHAPLQALPEHLALYQNISDPKRRTFAAMVHAVDEQVGRIVNAVDKRGWTSKTLFIFSSDNGGPVKQGASNGPFRAGKGTLYEGGVRVAAFATWPGRIPAGTTTTAPLHMVDWFPTLVKLAGGSLEQKLPIDGRDIWPCLSEGKPSPHEAILINTTPSGGAIRMGDWKLVLNGERQANDAEDEPANPVARRKRNRTSSVDVELFDLAHDPHEKKNLATANPEKVKELRTKLDAFSRQAITPKASPKAADFKTPKVWGEPNSEG